MGREASTSATHLARRSSDPVRLSLLRGFKLHRGTEVARLPRNAQRVVAFLALQDTPLRRNHVAQCLWLDVPEERASANLRTALWRIHQLDYQVVESQGDQIRLDESVVVDLRDAVVKARRLLDAAFEDAEGELTVESLEAELLPGWYEEWVLFEQERFRQLRLHGLEALCGRLVSRKRYAEAVQAGLTAVASEPLRETAQYALIAAFMAEGNVVDAIRQYRTYRAQLQENLGLDPGPLLHDLVRYLPVTARPGAPAGSGWSDPFAGIDAVLTSETRRR
jgi:DNA-binding SARP family transcriptional activator